MTLFTVRGISPGAAVAVSVGWSLLCIIGALLVAWTVDHPSAWYVAGFLACWHAEIVRASIMSHRGGRA